jgi:vanillate O-demethylase monooxygenase subunit
MLGEKVVLYRTEAGVPVALEDRCCHKFLPLSVGKLKGDAVECGYHGLTYDPSGACIRIPGQQRIPPQARVHSYPAVDHLGLVWIWPGDSRMADRGKLIQIPRYNAPGWSVSRGPYTPVKAAYQHLTDNLLDPAHVSFVHLSTLGSPSMADIPFDTVQDGDTVSVTRWTLNQPPVPIFLAFREITGNVDRWQVYQFYPPSISVTDMGIGSVGMGHSDAERDEGMRVNTCHFISPETERTSHYFWMQLRNFELGDDAASQKMTEQFITAFNEDKAVLEALQLAEDEGSPRTPMRLATDNGPQRSRRIIERLIRAEQQSVTPE